MKKFLLYSAGGSAIFIAGAVTATVIVGRMVLPVIDTDKVVEQVMLGYDRTQRKIMKKVFGADTDLELQPVVGVDSRYVKSSTYGK